MIADLEAWANLAIRWLHLIAGIAWIGSSFYFMWLDSHLKRPPQAPDGVAGELWSVHSGGFYRQIKFMVAPADMPEELHWFKWEAYTTWISGFLLLGLIFYVGADLNLIDKTKADLTTWQAIGLGLGSLVVGWLVYDGLCRSPIGQNPKLFGAVWFAVLVAAGYGLTRVFSDLGGFMHVGAIIGTVMAANVFMIIIPNQRKVVAQVLAGETPDPALGKQAKQRSVHNNYMTLPVLFIMISSHFPSTYGSAWNWLILAAIAALSIGVRHYFNTRHLSQQFVWTLPAAALGMLCLAFVSAPRQEQPAANMAVEFSQVQAVIAQRCASCHAAKPSSPLFASAPAGVMFDSPAQIRQQAARIKAQAVDSRIMPLGNLTQMTETERALLGRWIAEQTQAE